MARNRIAANEEFLSIRGHCLTLETANEAHGATTLVFSLNGKLFNAQFTGQPTCWPDKRSRCWWHHRDQISICFIRLYRCAVLISISLTWNQWKSHSNVKWIKIHIVKISCVEFHLLVLLSRLKPMNFKIFKIPYWKRKGWASIMHWIAPLPFPCHWFSITENSIIDWWFKHYAESRWIEAT